jgi:hypothetical protein
LKRGEAAIARNKNTTHILGDADIEGEEGDNIFSE